MKFELLCAGVFMLGAVDYVDLGNGVARVEILTACEKAECVAGSHMATELFPLILFPCEIEEGDMFYFEYADGVTEIRCGEPPD